MTRGVLVALLAAAALGCASPPVPAPTSATRDIAAEALAAFDSSDWATAAPLFRQLLARDPGSLRGHYSLALCAAHLQLQDEAVEQFRWVLEHAPSDSKESRVAREWLTAAEALGKPKVTAEQDLRAEHIGDSGLSGQVSWTEGESPVPTARLQLFLKGIQKTNTANLQFVRRTDQDGRFEFKRIPSGTYMITNKIAGEPSWRLRVEVPPGQTVALDLTPANGVKVRDDFPER